MLRNTILATALILTAGAATAQAEGNPVLHGAGDNAQVSYGGGQPGSIVGGGTVRMTGTGDEAAFTYGPVNDLPGRIGRLSGSGTEATVTYAPERPAARNLARTRNGAAGG